MAQFDAAILSARISAISTWITGKLRSYAPMKPVVVISTMCICPIWHWTPSSATGSWSVFQQVFCAQRNHYDYFRSGEWRYWCQYLYFSWRLNWTRLLYFQIQYNIIVRTGRRTYPRYFKLEFAFNRAKFYARPRRNDPAKVELQAQVIELRLRGWSFPAIAKYLDISVGTAWNMFRHAVISSARLQREVVKKA